MAGQPAAAAAAGSSSSAAAAAAGGSSLGAWLALTEEDALDPELPLVDAHHHLWDTMGVAAGSHVSVGRPGGTAAAVDPAAAWPQVPRYLLPDVLADIDGSGHNVVGTVYCECGSMYREAGPAVEAPLGETEFVTGMAAMAASGTYGRTRICAGITGTASHRRCCHQVPTYISTCLILQL